ncbi:MAG: DUF1573 domain-containing protein [Bacteroidales bacterium]|jgi:hypothetical protein|nr:DUF1573 domain-containing protein [Bacteroidales bacterium]
MKNITKPIMILCLAVFTLTGISLQAQEATKQPVKKETSSKTVATEEKANKAEVTAEKSLNETSNDTKKNAKNAKPAQITFDNLVHDYGTMKVGADGECVFTFKNTGKEPLIVSKVQGCCGVSVLDWTKDPVMPKKTGTIKLRYNTKRPITINKTVTVFTNDPEQPEIKLTLKGQIVEDTTTDAVKTGE